MMPPVGKSGPVIILARSLGVASGWSTMCAIAFATSRRLCGGMFVAMPTAMPAEPLTSRFGSNDGSTVGSWRRSSKFGTKSTVFFSMSASIAIARRVSFASV